MVLEPLYAAILEPERMGEFSEALCSATNSHVGAVMVHDQGHCRGYLELLVGADPAQAGLYEQEYAADNLWMQRGQHLMRPGSVMDSDNVATRTELKRTRYYNEYLRQNDIEQSIALCAQADADGVVVATLCRAGSLPPYTERELALMRQVAPHWVNAYAIQRRMSWLRQRVNSLESAVEAAPLAMVMLDGNMRATRMNQGAEQMFREEQVIRLRQGLPESLFDASRMKQLLHETINSHFAEDHSLPHANRAVLRDAAGRNALVAAAHPLGRGGDNAAVLFLQPLGAKPSLGSTLQQLFSLTQAEARLACALHQHGDLTQAAAVCDIGSATARTRIKLIYDKTGERSQSALMRLLAAVSSSCAP